MKVVRVSLYKNPYVRGQNPNDADAPVNQPMTLVLRESDLAVTPEEALNEQRFSTAEQGGFCTGEIFDVPMQPNGLPPTIKHVTILAERRRQRVKQTEVYQSMLYYWDADWLGRTYAHGTIAGTAPTPIRAAEVSAVLELLAVHPDYDHHTIIAFAKDGQRLTMKDGKIT